MTSRVRRIQAGEFDVNKRNQVPQEQPAQPDAEITSLGLLLARLCWAIVGPMVLFVVLVNGLIRGGGWFTGQDAAYGIIVVLMLVCRWLEQVSGRAKTAFGEPSSTQDFRSYCIALFLGSTAAWVMVKLIANYVLHP